MSSDPSDDPEGFASENNDTSASDDCDESPSKQKAKYLRRIKVEEDVQENGNGALDGDARYVHGAAPFGVEELEEGNFA